MATKLYPPYIEGTIPAFYGTTLVVPFALNRAVSKAEIAGFVLKIKTIQGSALLKTAHQTNPNLFDLDTKMQVSFELPDVPFVVGQHYKIQLAFLGADGEVGYFSTVGVTKYTTKPKVSIVGLTQGAINNHIYHYTGAYSQEGQDTTEKMYSSRFILRDSEGAVIADSGELLHNTSNDETPYESYENFTLVQDLKENFSYYLTFTVTTSNDLLSSTGEKITAGPYRLMQKKSVAPDIDATLKAVNNFEDGYIDLYLINNIDSKSAKAAAMGRFVVCRAASNDNYVWNQVCKFSLQSNTPSRFLWRDYTVEQGVAYKYSIQQFNDFDLYSDRIESNTITADFEDAFLYDGQRQLKIRYNPKVSSFKTDILETKLDTIGSKHPFIFRNGNVYYKEFPISGLISYQMDDNHLFLDKDSLGISKFTINYTPENVLAERRFKTEVLDWLNNGEPKLFRSSTEGNYIVRLMNNSLSPNDTLGRLLHTFSSTAYEIADFTYDNLNKLHFITIEDMTIEQTRWATIELAGHDDALDEILSNVRRYINAGMTVSFTEAQYNRVLNYYHSSELAKYFIKQADNETYRLSAVALSGVSAAIREQILNELEAVIGKVTYVTGRINSRPAYSVYMTDMLPGTLVHFISKNNGSLDDDVTIQIGATGSYSANFSAPVTSIVIPAEQTASELMLQPLTGSITYSYHSAAQNVFNTIQNVQIKDIPCRQWIGQPNKTSYDAEKDTNVVTTDLIDVIQDSKTDITEFYFLRFYARPMANIFIKDLKYSPEVLAKGVRIDDNSLDGISFELISLSEETYKPNQYYIEYTVSETIEGSDQRLTKTLVRLSTGDFNPTAVYYTAKFTYYSDMNCTQPLPFDKFDNYYVYAICHGRNDFTYVDTWYEGYYVYANFNRGYYVDKNGKRITVFTGKLLDGRSTSTQPILYDQETFTYKVSINGDELDLAETRKWELRDFDDPITSIKFNNGIICEASYQTRIITYNVEENPQSTVNSYKAAYESYQNKLYALKMIYSIEQERNTEGLSAVKKKELDALFNQYKTTLGDDYRLLQANNFAVDDYIALQRQYERNLELRYSEFIRQLDLALKLYKEENSL